MAALTLTQRITEAQRAYHELMTGAAVVSITDKTGERVEYRVANASQLSRYIQELQNESGASNIPGPLNIYF